MKVHNNNKYSSINKELLDLLNEERIKRNFDPEKYLKMKSEKLNNYMKKCKLDTLIVAISGGVDSAVSLGIANYSMKNSNVIKKVVAVTLPLYDKVLTNQNKSVERCNELSKRFLDVEYHVLPINDIFESNVKLSPYNTKDEWSYGQMGAYIRTSFLYFLTSELNSLGNKPVILGTTNMDEGSYLGYIGKASDGMVDLQIITDIHKSEVYQVAKYLEIPKSIIDVEPSGDMYDGRIDTEVFGAPYDIVELFLKSKQDLSLMDKIKKLSIDAIEEFNFYSKNLEKLHNYNSHKYLSLSPAIHLDLWSTEIKGGYINYFERIERFLNE